MPREWPCADPRQPGSGRGRPPAFDLPSLELVWPNSNDVGDSGRVASTIDHGLYAPAGFGSLERGYVALTRGATSSRIYATPGNGWRDTLGLRAPHTPALHQHPDPDRLRRHLPTVQLGSDAEEERAPAAVALRPQAW